MWSICGSNFSTWICQSRILLRLLRKVEHRECTIKDHVASRTNFLQEEKVEEGCDEMKAPLLTHVEFKWGQWLCFWYADEFMPIS